ncbi:MAG: NAD(P)H-dependent oxidoreductase subunit E [Lysobacterales bacterium]|jgi:[NiFe] hydrogenase diaphorase moiety large subunit
MQNLERFLDDLLAKSGDAPERLLQLLIAIQREYSHVPNEAIQFLSERLGVPPVQIYSVIEFYSFLHRNPRGEYDIYFSDNITDRMLGNRALMEGMCKKLGVELGVPRADGKVTVDMTSCTGLCDQGPAMLINGIAISRLTEERIHKIVGLIEAGIPVNRWPKRFFQIEDNIRRRDMLLTEDLIQGSAIESFLVKGADAVLRDMERSGLKGRGGAGFNTAMKWRFCRDAESDEHFVVCNADEGEPGTFKDRILLNSWADCVFEGMTICGAIIGARKGFLYLRGEYFYMLEALEKTLQERRDAKLLGKAILGRDGFDFDIEIHLGAGAYVCGEESALIESLEGKRGRPRIRPPFPVTSGYLKKPTVVNNVETFVAAARIAVFGGEWFRSKGTEQSHGTKLLSISGDCARPGIYEYAWGVTIRQVLEDCGAEDTQAVQLSGAAGVTIPPQEFYRKIAFEDVPTGGSFMIFNDQRDLLKMVLNFTRFFCHESCGFCTPCRVGGQLVNDIIEKVMVGYATSNDIDELRKIGKVMQGASHCGLGSTAPNAVLDTLEKFPSTYSKRLVNKSHEPSFNLDKALEVSRHLTGRDDEEAYLRLGN